jgi:nucleotidyltransferase substrate binding protein (TIGR01987 family)
MFPLNSRLTMQLDLLNLKNAASSLEGSLRIFEKPKDRDETENQTLRAGVIKNFEFTYELCWKIMKRWIETNVSPDIVTGVPRIHLFRYAAENELINDVEKWMEFHKARNKSAHIYGEDTAQDVFDAVKQFMPYLRDFLAQLEKRI